MRLATRLFLVLLLCASAGAGEYEDPRMVQIRQRIEAATENIAQSLIAEKSSPVDRSDAALMIGAFYELGLLGDKDPVRAVKFYRQAAETGSPDALSALASLYYAGAEGPSGRVERNPGQAMAYYEQAAEAGSAKAMRELGMIYADGMGVDPDPKRALAYFMDAAKRGDEESLRRLEPVMRNAREWEEAKPGRKANFPTRREEIIDEALAKKNKDRNFWLDRTANQLLGDLNRRLSQQMKRESQ